MTATCSTCHDHGFLSQRTIDERGAYRFRAVDCPDCGIAAQRRVAILAHLSAITPDMESMSFGRYDKTAANVLAGRDAVALFAQRITEEWNAGGDSSAIIMPHDQSWCVTLWGSPGTGKTALAACLYNALTRRGIPVLYTVGPFLWAHLGATSEWDEHVSYESRIRSTEQVPVLIIDEAGGFVDEQGRVAMTEKARSLRARVLRTRYDHRLPTLLLSQIDPRRWNDPALTSRIVQDGNPVVAHGATDYRQRNATKLADTLRDGAL